MSELARRLGYPEVILPTSASTSPLTAISFLVNELVRTGQLPAERADETIDCVLRRESMGVTALGGGVALPHTKSHAVQQVIGVVGTSPTPVRWPRARDEQPIHEICLMVAPISDPRAMLLALESAVRIIRGEDSGAL